MVSNSVKNNILLIFGIFIISYILFIRLILQRLTRELDKELPLIIKLIFIEIFIIFFISLINNLRNYLLRNNYYKPKVYNNVFLSFIKNKVQSLNYLWSQSLLLVHKKVLETQFSSYFEIIGSKLPKLFKFHNTYILTIIFLYVPKLIVLFSFLFDVFLLHQINYFYRTAWLLLLPLLYQYLCFAINDDAINGIIESDNYLIITPKNSSEQVKGLDYFKQYCQYRIAYYNEFDFSQFQYRINYKFFNDLTTIDQYATLTQFMLQINSLVDIASYTQFIIVWYEVHAPTFNSFLYSMYIIGWGYVLFLII